MWIISYIATIVLIFRFASASIECVEEGCKEDPVKTSLLSWYETWKKGFQVDYITTNELRESYDFIVVGAGIGGSVVAHRLAMDSSHPKVLLLEAGAKQDTSGVSTQRVPLFVQLNQLTDIDWQYTSEPSDGYCCEWHNEGRHAMPRGKVMGGSGVLNYMMWVRGHKDDWDELMNVNGWKWEDVLPYFKKAESLRAYPGIHNDAIRGYNGPVMVRSNNQLKERNNTFGKAVIDACKGVAGISYLETGQNNGDNIGIAYTEFNVDEDGHRHNAFIAYNQFMRRKYDDDRIQFDILPYAHVTRIVLEQSAAVGVVFVDISDERKKEYTVRLSSKERGEVVVSAGAINTPQILMLSGVGPRNELNKHNITVVSDIPGVGENLQDHVMALMRYHWKEEYQSQYAITADKQANILNDFDLFSEYLLKGRGYLADSSASLNGFIHSKYSANSYPDLQLYWLQGFNGITKYFNYRDNVYVEKECGDERLWDDVDNMQNILTVVGLQHPESKGYVRLKSKDPFDYPAIQPNYLKEQSDVDILKDGMKIMDDIMNHESIKTFWDFRMDCRKYGDIFTDDEALEQYIRDSIVNIYHPIGTCKMGDIENDNMAVVDNELRVRGIKNLRIADASILPLQTSGNTQVPVFMIGEKASDMILNVWNSKKM